MEQECIQIEVPEKQSSERLDVFLANRIAKVSRSKIKQIIETGNVTVNGGTKKPRYLIRPGEKIKVIIPRPEPMDLDPEKIPIDIVFEDESLLVVNKETGMVVHPGYGNRSGTLVNALLGHCKSLSNTDDPFRPGIVHRIDKDTSGLLVVAKKEEIHRKLADQFKKKTVVREYIAVVWGRVKKKEDSIDTLLSRSNKDRRKFRANNQGKRAVTTYLVKERFRLATVISLKLHTGRTHQIRVHCSYIGHPVFGDQMYGGRGACLGGLSQDDTRCAKQLLKIMPRQALHAKSLGFKHPVNGKNYFFDSELPEDMKLLIKKLREDRDKG
ncbi:MAG: RluA family pseudouridine synthase [bacterium]